jgi:hydroxyethylthiazole kinase
MSDRASLADAAWECWQAMRRKSPLVQCLTNDVAMDITANVLLAAGASPAMVASSDEGEHFAQRCANAVLINLGTLTSPAVAAQRLVMQAALAGGRPVVLDPVACGATPYRTAACVRALELKPTVVRGNAGEILALASAAGVWSPEEAEAAAAAAPTVRGVDSAVGSGDPRVLQAARALSRRFECVVAASGEVDLVVPGRGPCLRGRNGVEMLTRVTAAGCSMTALIAAFLAADAVTIPELCPAAAAAAAAMCVYGVAAELALERAERKGPGSLRAGLLDELYLMTREEFVARAKIEKIE